MLKLMAHYVLRRILEGIHSSQFLAVMVDEATDMSNKEQLTLVWDGSVMISYRLKSLSGCTLCLQLVHRALWISSRMPFYSSRFLLQSSMANAAMDAAPWLEQRLV